MARFSVRTLLVGRDGGASERFLVLAAGVSAITLLVLTLGRPLWQGMPDVVGSAFLVAYLVGTAASAAAYAYRNDGLLVTLSGTFVLLLGVGVYVGLTFVLCLVGRHDGCPTLLDKVLLGTALAASVAVPLGSVAFVVGAGGRRLRERWTGAS